MRWLQKIVTQAQAHLDTPLVQEYLSARGVSLSTARRYGIGYLPPDTWPAFTRDGGPDHSVYLAWSGKGVRLRGKLIIPVYNGIGVLQGIHLRSPDPSVKDYSKFYLAASKAEAVFLGTPQSFPAIYASGEIHLVEGTFDFFTLQKIVPNALCALTARVSARQEEFILRHARRLVLWFDRDEQGDALRNKPARPLRNTSVAEVLNPVYPGFLTAEDKDLSDLESRYGLDVVRSMLDRLPPPQLGAPLGINAHNAHR